MDDQISANDLKAILRHDPKTGFLFWLQRPLGMFASDRLWKSWNARFADQRALYTVHKDGYEMGEIFGRSYLAHRVVWALSTGSWPVADLDHKDGNRSNNKIDNLRPASRKENSWNRRSAKSASSKYLGVCWHKSSKKWNAQICLNGQKRHLGLFSSETQAAQAYDGAATKSFGQFANVNFPDEILCTFALRVEGVEV